MISKLQNCNGYIIQTYDRWTLSQQTPHNRLGFNNIQQYVIEALDDIDEERDEDCGREYRKRKRDFTAETAWSYFGGDDDSDVGYYY